MKRTAATDNKKIQVLIVGAGPVGLTLAAELDRFGITLRIVDKAPRRTDKSKALVLWSRTLELLERNGLSAALVAAGRPVVAANILADGKLVGRIDIAGVASPYPFALMLPQSETERLLEEHLQRRGVPVERSTELTAFTGGDVEVASVLRHVDGSEENLHIDWLVGCDGAHSTIRHGLGLEFLGDTLRSDWILADVHVAGFPHPESELATYWHQDGVLIFFPISTGRFRVIADVGLAAGSQPAEPTLAEVQALIDRRGPLGVRVADPIWLSGFRINERKVSDYRSGRVFVAGDAAHVHSPAGGQGMNTGMQDAFNLAWKLALVCRRNASPELLDSYSAERSAVGDAVLKAAGRLTQIGVMKNRGAQALRNVVAHWALGLTPILNAMVDTMTEVSIGYRRSPLNGMHARGTAGPAPGERVAPRAGQPPLGCGDTPRFTLLAQPEADVHRLLAQFPSVLDPTIRPPPDTAGIWLVRPDGYVACVAPRGDADPVATYLRALAPSALRA